MPMFPQREGSFVLLFALMIIILYQLVLRGEVYQFEKKGLSSKADVLAVFFMII